MIENKLDLYPQFKPGPVIPRLFMGLGNLSNIEIKGWFFPQAAQNFASGLMAEIDYRALLLSQKKVVSDFFNTAMYFNCFLDRFVKDVPSKFKKEERKSDVEKLDTVEKFWNLPTRVNELSDKALEAGYSAEAVGTIEEWFKVNKIINLVSFKYAENREIDWDNFLSDFSDRPGEVELAIKITEVFKKIENPDQFKRAIMFRSISSAYFAKTLTNLGCCGKEQPAERNRKLKRMTGMVMLAQILDDFGTPSKEKQCRILGIAALAIKQQEVDEKGRLHPDNEDTKRAVSLIRQVMGGALEVVNVSSYTKRYIARQSLIGLSLLSFLRLSVKHGGTDYPKLPLIKAVLNELKRPKEADQEFYPYREYTRKALIEAVQMILP